MNDQNLLNKSIFFPRRKNYTEEENEDDDDDSVLILEESFKKELFADLEENNRNRKLINLLKKQLKFLTKREDEIEYNNDKCKELLLNVNQKLIELRIKLLKNVVYYDSEIENLLFDENSVSLFEDKNKFFCDIEDAINKDENDNDNDYEDKNEKIYLENFTKMFQNFNSKGITPVKIK